MKKVLVAIGMIILSSCASNTRVKPGYDPKDFSEPCVAVVVPPRYPYFAARNGVEGYVTFTFDLNDAGHPINVEVVESSPADVFDYDATRAFKKWQFKPVMKNCTSTERKNLRYSMDFSLAD